MELDSGDGCTALPMYLLPLNYTPESVKMANFMCIFHNINHSAQFQNLAMKEYVLYGCNIWNDKKTNIREKVD